MPDFRELEFGSDLYRKSVELRNELLRKPLGLHFSLKEMEAEKDEAHLAAISTDKEGKVSVDAILLLRKTDKPDVIKMRQVATSENKQGMGIGSALVQWAEQFARNKAYKKIELNARQPVVPFYQRLGYNVVSDVFLEIGIPHYKMEKNLQPEG